MDTVRKNEVSIFNSNSDSNLNPKSLNLKIRDSKAKEYTLSEYQWGIFNISFFNLIHFHLFDVDNSCLHILTVEGLIIHIITQCFGFILLLLYIIFFLATVFRTELYLKREQICVGVFTLATGALVNIKSTGEIPLLDLLGSLQPLQV